MHINEKEQRLKELLENNIRSEKIGIAIAVTGSWGVGKTFFWNNFLNSQLSEERIYKKDNVFNRKYAYVSLFGVESLSDLKTQIYSNIENNHSSIEVPKWLKGLPSIFKDTRVSGLGISAPVKLIDNLMFNQVKDSIICFDDFERMSNKLDIKDVMGLANQLKLERNCQVILILDESKTEESNKNKYAEYKEKLIDETIKIVSVEPLIRDKSKGIDAPLVDLMVKFADELDIYNFRFFQKVINLYKQFRKKLPEIVAASTKEIILIRILQGYFIEDFGQNLDINWDQFTLKSQVSNEFKKKHDKDFISKENIQLNLINSISPIFSQNDLWAIEFKNWFEQKCSFDSKVIQELIVSDLNNEDYAKAKACIDELIRQYKTYNIDANFGKNLASLAKKTIKFETLENIDFYCSFLLNFNEIEQINEIDQLVQTHLESEFITNRDRMLKLYYWHQDETQKYRSYIKNLLNDPDNFSLEQFMAVLKLYIQRGEINYGAKEILSKMTKKSLEKFILEDYPNTFRNLSLKTICEKIIELYVLKEISIIENVKIWLKEIIEEKGQIKKFPKHYIHFFTENL